MTDKQFQKLINDTITAKVKHLELLKKAEEEYEKRCGNNPSDIDDDSWIDPMLYGQGHIKVEDIGKY